MEFAALHFFKEFAKTGGQALWRIMGIQATGLRQQPDPALMQAEILQSRLRPRAQKNFPEDAYSEKSQITWTILLHSFFQFS